MRAPRLHELPPPPAGRHGWPWTEETKPPPPLMPGGRRWPRISVTTPSFEQAEFLEETIRSVLLQGYPDLECIVVDGGSRDGSVAILERYAPWLSYWCSEPDRGQADAVDKGWLRASGEVLAYLNSDDVYEPGALAVAARALDAEPAADLVYGDCLIVDEHSRVIDAMRGADFDLAGQLRRNLVPQPTIFVRRAVVAAIGPLDASLDCTHDQEFCVRVGMDHRMKRVPLPLARFRLHARAKSHTRLDVVFEEWVANLAAASEHERLRALVPATPARQRALALFNTAIFCYGNGDSRAAIARFARAARLDPTLAARPEWWAYLMKCAAGAGAMRRLRALRHGLDRYAPASSSASEPRARPGQDAPANDPAREAAHEIGAPS